MTSSAQFESRAVTVVIREFTGVEREILDYVYAEFGKDGSWPLARTVDVDLGDSLDPAGGLQHVCDTIGSDYIACNPPDSDGRVALRLRALELFDDAAADLENFLGATRYFARRYRETRGRDREVELSDYAREVGLDAAAEKRLNSLILLEGRYWQGASGGHFTLNAFAGKVGDVSSVADYLARWSAYTERQSQRARGVGGAETADTRHVFLSHASADSKLARYIGDVIRSSVGGVEVFVASNPGEIATGEEWLAVIKDQLRRADTYVVLLTPRSIERSWIWFETGAAWMGERRLLPVTVGLAKDAVPMPLAAHQVLSLEELEDATQLFRDLKIAVSKVGRFCAEVAELSREGLHGSVPKRESTVGDALAGFRRSRHLEARDETLRSSVGVRAAQQAVRALFQELTVAVDRANGIEEGLRFRVGFHDNILVIQGLAHSLSVVWEMARANSLNHSGLYVMEVEGRLALPGTMEPSGRTEQGEITHYDFSLDESSRPVWVEREGGRALTVEQFSELWVANLIRSHTAGLRDRDEALS